VGDIALRNTVDTGFSASMNENYPARKGVCPIEYVYGSLHYHQKKNNGATLCRGIVKEIGVWSLYD
jgi:hypothetical protein